MWLSLGLTTSNPRNLAHSAMSSRAADSGVLRGLGEVPCLASPFSWTPRNGHFSDYAKMRVVAGRQSRGSKTKCVHRKRWRNGSGRRRALRSFSSRICFPVPRARHKAKADWWTPAIEEKDVRYCILPSVILREALRTGYQPVRGEYGKNFVGDERKEQDGAKQT